jgi:hypothetical protein
MPLAGHMTKLQAVNEMLWSIGEDPVNSLDSGLPDAETAEAILDRISREIQLQGWYVNTLRNYQLTTNVDGQFVLPDNTLKVDTVNPRGNRIVGSPTPAAHINVVMRRSADDTKWVLWDVENNTETWTNPTTLVVDLTQNLEFANLSPALQVYVWTKAAHRFQKGAMGSAALFQFTLEDVNNAMAMAEQEDLEASDVSMLRDNPHVYRTVWRNNPNWGI